MSRPGAGHAVRVEAREDARKHAVVGRGLADWPTSSIQPPSEPTDFRTAHTLMMIAPVAPIASARGFCERRVRRAQLLVRQDAHDDGRAQHVDHGGERRGR